MCKQYNYIWSSTYDNPQAWLPVLNVYFKSLKLGKLILFLSSTARNNYHRSDGWELEHLEVFGNEYSNEDDSEILYTVVWKYSTQVGGSRLLASYCISPPYSILVPLMLYYSCSYVAVLYVLNKA